MLIHAVHRQREAGPGMCPEALESHSSLFGKTAEGLSITEMRVILCITRRGLLTGMWWL